MILSRMRVFRSGIHLSRLSLIPLSILAFITISYTILHTGTTAGAIDFHSYWYSGIFLRQGGDPYTAYLRNLQPNIPVYYLDGSPTLHQPVAQPGLANVPANTAPIILILSSLSFFTWPTAKALWMVGNLAFMVVIPGLLIRLLPEQRDVGFAFKAIILFGFLGLFGVRNSAGNGQTSLLIMLLMLLAWLLVDRKWFWAGITLGMALSKFSLSLPLFILFLLQKRYRLLATALLFQLTGLLLLSILTGQSPITIVQAQLQIILLHSDLPGIHLGSLFTGSTPALMASLTITIFIALSLYRWHKQPSNKMVKDDGRDFHRIYTWHLMAILSLWTLLVAYHRAYDTILVAIVLVLLLYGLTRENIWAISKLQYRLMMIFSIIFYIFLVLPASSIFVLARWAPAEFLQYWLNLQSAGITISLLIMLVCSTWLLTRITREKEASVTILK
jgi:hypothetical protein